MAQIYSDQLDIALESARDAVRNVADGTIETARNAQKQVADAGRRVQDKIDEARLDAAGKLNSAASALHQKAEDLPSLPGRETVAGMAHGAADRIESTAHYVREHDMRRVAAGVERFVRRRPAESLFAAIALGFFLGRAFRRGD